MTTIHSGHLAIPDVPWKDLVRLRPWEQCIELLLPTPFLALALYGVGIAQPVLAFLGFAYFYLAGLRLVHDGFHGNLGFPRWGNHAVMLVLSGLMLGSMHAIRVTHLQHHRDCLGPTDVEGATARRRLWVAIVAGLAFPLALHRAALRRAGPSDRAWIWGELALTGLVASVAIIVPLTPMRVHLAAMMLAQALTGFFAVWTVHHDVDPDRHVARTVRNHVKSMLVLGMFFHLEHHLFPRVPTRRLPILAARIDRAAPELGTALVY